ncbi:MAG: Nif3-like dinuclear metal center hexameric protein [Lentisphaeria bacterium]|nr:Nif3-like dinuclear metal center hexameric protein [Lentisphaeria bacterium]
MVNKKVLVNFLDKILDLPKFAADSSNNGLQVETRSKEVKKIALAVDASLETFERAIEADADFILVHHGLSWGSHPKVFNSYVGKRLECLFSNDVSLYAVHLPLDANKEFGHNAELSKIINLPIDETFFEYCGVDIGVVGTFDKPKNLADIQAIYEDRLDTKGKVHGDCDALIHKVAVCSGGGGSEAIIDAAAAGADLLITGEFFHTMYHIQKELNINVLSLGHYATETVGLKALGKIITEKFDVECEFIDVPTKL